eukprot:TRINITY_DN21973_c1_g3_i1.p1 TRINITY_DN21973_c1_g3~~TRINITY_DN21973_c1_g3_i1.p1  ORF type:complete len:338 (-),score=44.27 TRINITY_DN21973_c1_g3_i1:367-1380(-)
MFSPRVNMQQEEVVPNNEAGLRLLAFKGKWETLLDKLGNLEVQTAVNKQVQQSYRLLALVRRKKYDQALEIWQEVEKKAQTNGGEVLDIVPFAQLILSWEIFLHTNHDSQAAQQLNQLYCKVKERYEKDVLSDVWARRYGQVTCTLIQRYLEKKDHTSALKLLNELLKISPKNPDLWSQSVMVLLMQGCVQQAARLTKWIQDAENIDWKNQQHKQNTVLLLQGLMNFAVWDLDQALVCFSTMDRQDGENPQTRLAGIINEAIVRVYKEDMNRGVSMLEKALKDDIHTYCQESLVFNLCVMYEQQKTMQGSQQAKKALLDWLSLLAPQDFNMKVTRLQ